MHDSGCVKKKQNKIRKDKLREEKTIHNSGRVEKKQNRMA